TVIVAATAVITATVTGRVVAQDAHARERGIALDPHVVRTGGRRAEAAALAVAGLVRAAVIGAVGRRAAELHVKVGIAAAAGHGEDQVRGTGRHGHGEVDRLAGRTRLAGHRNALGQGAIARIRIGIR